jgi:hypothetical protein
MVQKIYTVVILFYSFCSLGKAQKVGINIDKPDYFLDVRGTDDLSIGANLQLATPSETDFLRFFSGSLGDRNPFMAFHDLDTFHFVTTLRDFSTYMRRMTILPNGRVGMGTDKPESELDIRTFQSDDGAEVHVSNQNASHFLRLFSGEPTNPRPAIIWNFGSTLDFARFDDNLDYRPFLTLDGKTIGVLNNNESVYLGNSAGTMGSGFGNTGIGSSSLQNKTIGAQNTALGYGAGNGAGSTGSTVSGNVLIGYEAGYNLTQSNRLYIENSSSASPLIYGEFDNNLLRINGRQEITGNLNLNQGIASGIALSVNGQEALWSNGSYFSYGFGTGHNYFAKPIKIGPIEGSTVPNADLQIVDNSDAILSIESRSNKAILQLVGNYANQTRNWTMTVDNTLNRLTWKHNNDDKLMVLNQFGDLGIGKDPSSALDVVGDLIVSSGGGFTTPFLATIRNTSNSIFTNGGLEITAGMNTYNSMDPQPEFIRFNKPSGTFMGAIRQVSNSSIQLVTTSDRRLKTDIIPTSKGLSDILRLQVRDYYWKEDLNKIQLQTGFIAQELYEVIPNAVYKGGDDFITNPWGISTSILIPLVVKSIQDQQNEIETLRKENEDLISRIERLEGLIENKMK